jgi:hypothetical protein
MSVPLITMLPLRAVSVHGCERGLEFICLYMRFFVSKRILSKTSNTIHGLRTPLARQEKAGGIRAVMQDVRVKAEVSVGSEDAGLSEEIRQFGGKQVPVKRAH